MTDGEVTTALLKKWIAEMTGIDDLTPIPDDTLAVTAVVSLIMQTLYPDVVRPLSKETALRLLLWLDQKHPMIAASAVTACAMVELGGDGLFEFI